VDSAGPHQRHARKHELIADMFETTAIICAAGLLFKKSAPGTGGRSLERSWR
jgi:hypothetical protein